MYVTYFRVFEIGMNNLIKDHLIFIVQQSVLSARIYGGVLSRFLRITVCDFWCQHSEASYTLFLLACAFKLRLWTINLRYEAMKIRFRSLTVESVTFPKV